MLKNKNKKKIKELLSTGVSLFDESGRQRGFQVNCGEEKPPQAHGDRVMGGEDERTFLPHPSVAAAAGLTAVTRCDGSPSRGSAVKGAAADESARE